MADSAKGRFVKKSRAAASIEPDQSEGTLREQLANVGARGVFVPPAVATGSKIGDGADVVFEYVFANGRCEAVRVALSPGAGAGLAVSTPKPAAVPVVAAPAPVIARPAPPPAGPPVVTPPVPAGSSALENYPFGFAAWHGSEPWGRAADGRPAPDHASFDRGLRSGVLTVTLEAVTPLLVSTGGGVDSGEATAKPALSASPGSSGAHYNRSCEEPWACEHPEGGRRFGIPGSSMKGAVRTHYEIWTNSSLGVVSGPDYERPIPYRRRVQKVWVIEESASGGAIVVKECESRFVQKGPAGVWLGRQATAKGVPAQQVRDTIQEVQRVDPGNEAAWQAVQLRANLLWTPDHEHPWTHLAVRVRAGRARITESVASAYRKNLEHGAFSAHPGHVKKLPVGRGGGSRNHYSNIENESEQLGRRVEDLGRLEKGDVIFGVCDGDRSIISFGKNVNYLWPSQHSPRELVGGFWPSEEQLSSRTADPAQAMFGFAAPHREGPGEVRSHPFRARVRFTTFWATEGTRPAPPVDLGLLMAPPGTKLKARPIYLAPGKEGRSASYDDPSPKLRGRKVYWHQRLGANENVPASRPAGADPAKAGIHQSPLSPLPAGTVFRGRVHFENLEDWELGGLLVALAPDLFWEAHGAFGFKLGKGKPRGWGSVRVTDLELRLRATDGCPFARLNGKSLGGPENEALPRHVLAFKEWLCRTGQVRSAEELSSVQDLAQLLRLPLASRMLDYPPPNPPSPYGWMPRFDDLHGEPPGGERGRPGAMPMSRALNVR